jgi:ribosomal protein S18 acetylase RimI-like enzyme
MVDRLRRALARHGFREVVRRGLAAARGRVTLREEHVWYELPLPPARAPRGLPEGAALLEADDADADLLDGLPSSSPDSARRLRARGGRLFLVVEDGVALFACWIHERETPTIAACDGWLALPEGTVCLEDSVTAPEARGRGIAPAAWSELAGRLAAEGTRTMVTKVEVANAPSRKAVEKAGFSELGRMRLRRVLGRTTVELEGAGPLAAALRAGLGR